MPPLGNIFFSSNFQFSCWSFNKWFRVLSLREKRKHQVETMFISCHWIYTFTYVFSPFVFFFAVLMEGAISSVKGQFSTCAKNDIPFYLGKNLEYLQVMPFYCVLLISFIRVWATHILKIKFYFFCWTHAALPFTAKCLIRIVDTCYLSFLIFHSLWIMCSS